MVHTTKSIKLRHNMIKNTSDKEPFINYGVGGANSHEWVSNKYGQPPKRSKKNNYPSRKKLTTAQPENPPLLRSNFRFSPKTVKK